jgi:hypothetical protein
LIWNSLIVRPAAEILRSPAHPARKGARGSVVGKLAVDVGLRAMCSVAPGRAILYMVHCRFGCINRRSTCTSAAYSEPFLSSLSLSFFCVERESSSEWAWCIAPVHRGRWDRSRSQRQLACSASCGPCCSWNSLRPSKRRAKRVLKHAARYLSGRRPSPVLGRTASAAHEFFLIATRDSRQHATAAGGAVATSAMNSHIIDLEKERPWISPPTKPAVLHTSLPS